MHVNDFTKFTVMENFTKKFCFMVKKLVSDGLFGSTTTVSYTHLTLPTTSRV